MKQASLTHLRRNLSTYLNEVNNEREPLIVTRRRGKPVVMISLEDYQAMERVAAPAPQADSMRKLLSSLSEVDEITFVSKA